MLAFITILALSVFAHQENYIINGDFEIPAIANGSILLKMVEIYGWYGSFDLHGSFHKPGTYFKTQIMEASAMTNGFFAQNVRLPKKGVYNLSF